MIFTYKLGNYRRVSQNAVHAKFSNFSLQLEPNKTYTILTKLKSKSPIDASWVVSYEKKFISFIMYDILFWGIFFGFVLSLVFYNISIFTSLKDYTYVAYAFHGLSAMLFQFATNGVFYQFELYENPIIFNSISWVLAQLSLITILLFSMLFFNTKRTMPTIHKILHAMLVVVIFMAVLFIYSFENVEIINSTRSIAKPITLFISLFVLAVALMGFKKKIEGALYYLSGHGIFLLALFYQQFGGVINKETSFLSIYIVALGMLFDVIFLSLALGQKLAALKQDKETNQKLLISQSGFSAIGRTVGNLSHQWKIPVARLGTLITQMEAMLWRREDKLKYELEEVLVSMRGSLDFMQNSINEFNNFYLHSSQKTNYNLSYEIENILNLLGAKVMYSNCTVHKELDPDIELFGYKSAFANVCLVIIDNALDIFKQRGVAKAQINIRLTQENGTIKLTFEDNGGGIKIEPIQKIFDVFVSDKEDGNGMGLAMTQVLVKERLGGNILVYNGTYGAVFEVTLPVYTKNI